MSAHGMIAIDQERCTGCRLCELSCSYHHEGVFQPAVARIRVKLFSKEGFSFPQLCLQCADVPCMGVCKPEAIRRNPETGVTDVDHDLCTGCRQCLSACPYGGMFYSQAAKKAVACDLCQGDPRCIQNCYAGALSWIDEESSQRRNSELFEEAAARQATRGVGVAR